MPTATPAKNLADGEGRKIVLLPIGSYEQHGPHLPVDTDLRIAQLVADQLCQSFPDKNIVLLPAIPFSCSWEHKGLGTIALGTTTISSILYDVAQSLSEWKIPVVLVLLSWHGGNSALSSIATEISARIDIPTMFIPAISIASEKWNEVTHTTFIDAHAGALETSIIYAQWPGLVDQHPGLENLDCVPDIEPLGVQSIFQALGIYGISKSGIWGKPQQAKPEEVQKIIEYVIEVIHEQIVKLSELLDKNNK